MLVRAARKQRRPARKPCPLNTSNVLPLSFLYPAFLRCSHQSATAATSSPTDTRRTKSGFSLPNKSHVRPLVTASSFANPPPSIFSQPADILSWNNSQFAASTNRWDPQSPLVVSLPPPSRNLNYRQGIGGTSPELLQNLYASIRVGRLDRAAIVVGRIRDSAPQGSSEVIQAHNIYLDGLFKALSIDDPPINYTDIRNWYKRQIIDKHDRPNAKTLNVMIRATIAAAPESHRKTFVDEYVSYARNHNMYAEVMGAEYSIEEWLCLETWYPNEYAITAEEEAEAMHEVEKQDVAEARETRQKGLGLSTLKKTLSTLDGSYGGPTANLTQEQLYERQVELEETTVEIAMDRWRKEQEKLSKLGVKQVGANRSIDAWMARWFTSLTEVLTTELKMVRTALANKDGNDADRQIYGPYMELFAPDKLAAITILSILEAFSTPKQRDGPSKRMQLVWLTMRVTKNLQQEHAVAAAKERSPVATSRSQTNISAHQRAKYVALNLRHQKNTIPNATQEDNQDDVEFSLVVRAKLGAVLLEKLISSATIDNQVIDPETGQKISRTQPAFTHTSTYSLGKKTGKIEAHHILLQKLRSEPVHASFIGYLPMLTEPKKWSGLKKGAYLKYPVEMIRFKARDETQMTYANTAAKKGDLAMVFAGLDVLGKTPWRINKSVLTVMIDAWNSGEALGSLAPESSDIAYPPEPGPGADLLARRKWMREVRRLDDLKGGYHSNRCFQNFQIEIARSFREHTFYYPHNVDFRGRAYPIPPLLNHMGADPARGLLVFGKGKELGEVGLRWLKIHMANLAGFDKASLSDRERFAMDHLDDIYDSAVSPLTGKRWWLKAEDPWQCLACCFEIKNAMDLSDPTKYVSYLPVHQDGTCNGLQHYAALGGDAAGAAQVNLLPGDRPADVYTGVADLVKKEIRRRADEGHKFAKLADGMITRKVVKQTVMTNVYGVTFFGAKLQVQKQLEELNPNASEEERSNIRGMALEIANAIFGALGTLFTGAQNIQHWLAECASRITSSLTPEQMHQLEADISGGKGKSRSAQGSNLPAKVWKDQLQQSTLVWTTPLKLPVVQPYRDCKTKIVSTALQQLRLRDSAASDPVNRRKQVQGFPPNFVHSLDATHMLLSALRSDELGLTFAAVHDSFWTHAADIPTMNTVLRDTFVRMHSEDIITRLAEEFQARYGSHMRLVSIRADSDIARKIKDFRSEEALKSTKKGKGATKHGAKKGPKTGLLHATTQELLAERKRSALLTSKDPNKQAEGRKMMTPTSIYEECIAAGMAVPTAPAEAIALGGNKRLDMDNEVGLLSDEDAATLTVNRDGDAAPCSEDLHDDPESEIAVSEEADIDDETQLPRDAEEAAKSPTRLSFVTLWAPMSFPPVPQKGDFDVARLKQSEYFFS
ncbi:DNA/RNA polymerase [Pseudovirgaria hyperparasitica]|uniref:DNA-directed RNA polymerase n=1 Tax=Pseudovirgaria hyperparasitica TaxID=470096 RepID=A0A6A6VXP0_9PEZI|nr:DNA/RNA polymerase [Pseudovirgaria hyperparasitica]KAF2755428.1 DNA/RNA polymerase [Pseudovirgaria hyperparasitica]